jgi:hypothetical protein
MERIDRKKQIAISKQEANELSNEFIQIFIAADIETGTGFYSMMNIKKRYPNIAVLYFAITEP